MRRFQKHAKSAKKRHSKRFLADGRIKKDAILVSVVVVVVFVFVFVLVALTGHYANNIVFRAHLTC